MSSILAAYRPFRVGYLVPEGSLEAVREAARISTALWGGRYNPIIPIVDIERIRQMVASYHVDGLLVFGKDNQGEKIRKQFPHLNMLEMNGELFQETDEGKRSSLLSTRQVLRRIYDESYRGRDLSLDPIKLVHWQASHPLADVLHLTFGQFPGKDECGFDYVEAIKANFKPVSLGFELDGCLSERDAFAPTPLGLGRLDLDRNYSIVKFSHGGPGIYCGDPTSFNDLVNYWNLLAADKWVVFLDQNNPQWSVGAAEAIASAVYKAVEKRPRFFSKPTVWLDKTELEPPSLEFLAEWDVASVWSKDGEVFCLDAPAMRFVERSVQAIAEPDSMRRLTISLPQKPWLQADDFSHEYVMVSIKMFGEQAGVLVPPYLPELNRFYDRKLRLGTWAGLRSEQGTVAACVSCNQDWLDLFPIPEIELVTEVFKLAGMQVAPSQAGRVAQTMISHLGGIRECEIFKISGVRDLLANHAYDQSFSLSTAQRTMKTTWKELYDSFSISRPKGSALKVPDVLRHCVEKGIFRLGYELACAECELQHWCPIEDLASSISCPYCGCMFQTQGQVYNRRPRWRPSGVFGRKGQDSGATTAALVTVPVAICSWIK